jgi:hypothetical protein
MDGLSCEWWLIGKNSWSLKNQTIYWNIHTILDLDDISDLDVFFMKNFFLSISLEGDLNFKLK